MPLQTISRLTSTSYRQRTGRNVAAWATAAGSAVVLWRSWTRDGRVEVPTVCHLPDSPAPTKPRTLPPWLISLLSGAVGECAAQVFLFPVESLKVLCQKNGVNIWITLRTLLCTHKSPVAVLSRLYQGVGTTIGVSCLLGAIYLGVFEGTTRGLSRFQVPSTSHSAPHTTPSSSQHAAATVSHCSSHGDSHAALIGAAVTSLIIAMLTGPLEMARNRVQAGMVQESLLKYTLSGRGIRATLPFMAPFMLTSVPHDFAELVVNFQGGKCLRKLPEDSFLRSAVPQEAMDALVGATAGAAGVLLSQPADCIKTKVLTNHGLSSVGAGPGSAGVCIRQAWIGAARSTAAAQGPRGLYVGLLPRLVDEVPGSMLHWTFVASMTRALQQI